MNLVFLSSLAICYSSFLPAFPDCNNNGIDDTQDIATCNGDPACSDCNDDGRPDECGVFIDCDTHETQKLHASDAAAGDFFGTSVSLSGDIAVVGASDDNCVEGDRCGAAYVFRFDGTTWIQEQKLTASDAEERDRFGRSVSVSGDTAIVGSRSDDCAMSGSCGSAYVFRLDGISWVEEQKLTASDAAAGDNFGNSVSLSEDIALVGAGFNGCAAGDVCGAAYIYRFNGNSWEEEQKLTASDAEAGDIFGSSVALNGLVAVVGALRRGCAAGPACGVAFVFRFNGSSWIEEQKLVAPDAAQSDSFGASVAVSGDVAIVGARLDDCPAGIFCGSAYVFRYNGTSWDMDQKLTASNAAEGDSFGHSVSVSGDTILVGTFATACAAGSGCGSVYVFRFNGTSWVEEQELTASDAAAGDAFGSVLSVNGDTAVAGASFDDCSAGDSCGSMYVLDLVGADCNCNAAADSCELLAGTSGDCNENGIPDDCEADCNNNGLADDCDIRDDASVDCNSNGTPDECEPDCNQNGVADGCDFDNGVSADCNTNGIPDECEPDCNGNGIPDACDIAVGLKSDCNSNGIPDSCDLRDGTSVDIDGDGLIDDCDTFFPIPTVSEWGMAVLALLLLILAKVAFRRRILA